MPKWIPVKEEEYTLGECIAYKICPYCGDNYKTEYEGQFYCAVPGCHEADLERKKKLAEEAK